MKRMPLFFLCTIVFLVGCMPGVFAQNRPDSLHSASSTNSAAAARTVSHPQTTTDPTDDGNPEGIKALMDEGDHYLEEHRGNAAVAVFYKGLQAARVAGDATAIERAQKGLSDGYEMMNDPGKAALHYREYVQVRDSLADERETMIVNGLNTELEAARNQVKALAADQQFENLAGDPVNYLMHHRELAAIAAACILLVLILLVVNVLQGSRLKKAKRLLNAKGTETGVISQAGTGQDPTNAVVEDAEMAYLTQISPAFISDSLHKIREFVLQNNMLSAYTFLSKFLSLMEKALDNCRQHLIPIGKEMEVTDMYAELQRQMLDKPFAYNWKLNSEDDLVQYLATPLILQPFVENAIRNLDPNDANKALSLSLTREDNQLIIVVEDNGTGAGNDHGNQLLRRRVALLNSRDNADIRVQYFDLQDNDGKPRGTRVKISVPVREK